MSIEKRTVPYEIFIRFEHGEFKGAHLGELEQFLEDGKVVSETELPVRPITEAECGKYIGEQSAKLIEAADAARAEAVAIREEAARQMADTAGAAADKVAAAEQAREEATAEAERLASELAAAQERNAALEKEQTGFDARLAVLEAAAAPVTD